MAHAYMQQNEDNDCVSAEIRFAQDKAHEMCKQLLHQPVTGVLLLALNNAACFDRLLDQLAIPKHHQCAHMCLDLCTLCHHHPLTPDCTADAVGAPLALL